LAKLFNFLIFKEIWILSLDMLKNLLSPRVLAFKTFVLAIIIGLKRRYVFWLVGCVNYRMILFSFEELLKKTILCINPPFRICIRFFIRLINFLAEYNPIFVRNLYFCHFILNKLDSVQILPYFTYVRINFTKSWINSKVLKPKCCFYFCNFTFD
jgi:hypothetical protein